MAILSTQTARFSALPAPALSLPTGPRTVFLVHRSDPSNSPIKTALHERGYDVIHAESVDAALRTWVKLARRVDLFLADINLGNNASIEQLIKLLQAENPRMRVLYANDLEQSNWPMAAQNYPRQLVAVVDNCLA